MKTNNQNKQLKQALYDRIEAEKVCPKSKIFFRSQECLVWLVWAISIVLGAFSVAVSLFVVTHGQYSFYEATHENFLTFMVETLPYIWIIAFGLLIIIAIYNLRHTAHGYKYPVWVIISSSLVLSFAGGSAMQFFGLGYKIDNILGKNMDMYMSQDKLERFMWQKPMDGRLVGRQVLSTVSPTSTVIFEDQGGQRWRLNISDLKQEEIERLASEESVRLLGKPVNPEMFIFHACGVFPAMMDRNVSLRSLSDERKTFVKRMYEHIHKAENLIKQEFHDQADLALPEKSICAEIAVVKRMPIERE